MSSSSSDPSDIKNLDVPGLYTTYNKKGNLWAVFMMKSVGHWSPFSAWKMPERLSYNLELCEICRNAACFVF